MKPAPFAYYRPSTRREVDELLAAYGTDAKILAGGQSLVPMLNMRLVSPPHLIDLNGLQQEPLAPYQDDAVACFGPLVRHEAIEASALVQQAVPLLHEAIRHVGHPAVRSRGTFVGALANADPASELPPVLVLLGGEVHVRSSRGARRIMASEFFAGPLEPAIAADEWIEEVRLPCCRAGEGFAVEEFARRDADFALSGVVARVAATEVALAFFGLAEMATRLTVEGLTAAELHTTALTTTIRNLVARQLDLPDDIHASAAFRAHLAERLAVRAVRRAATTSGGFCEGP